jgi:type VI secretion system protein ImpG
LSRDRFESFYESELSYIRKLGAEFAKKRPKIAGRLLMREATGVSTDPHVERLIESFAFLTARIRLKLDDQFPELTESLLGTLYPHYLAPIPSMGIAQFEVDPERGKLPKGYLIARHGRLFTHEIRGVSCRFRTAYPVTLWPVEVKGAHYQTPPFGRDVPFFGGSTQPKALVRIELQCAPGMKFSDLLAEKMRFFLSGEDQHVYRLQELLFNHAVKVVLNPPPESGARPVELPHDAIRPVGFEADEGLLPYSRRSFLGYRLLTEFFCFPEKFLFFDLTGLERMRTAGFGDRIELLVYLDRSIPSLESQVNANTFRLGCTPVVNLFEQECDPIRVTHTQSEYPVVPDVRNQWAMEVYSVEAVQSIDVETQEATDYQPFYSFKQATADDAHPAYWTTSRTPSVRENDPGTDVSLSLVDRNLDPATLAAEVLQVRTICSNRELPRDLRNTGGEDWGYQLEGQSPVRRISPVVHPTAPRRLPLDELRWRLVSHLSLNHLSISDDEDGAAALREILKLYEYPAAESLADGDRGAQVSRRQIQGLLSVTSKRKVARINDGAMQGFCRGVEVTITFNEEDYAGSGLYLFAAVLERFIGMYASINSVTSLVAKSNLREGFYKQWPFRAGEQAIV